jgi:hypothetical protein
MKIELLFRQHSNYHLKEIRFFTIESLFLCDTKIKKQTIQL